ncbi:1871_t:CDS:2, partial [Entrophospora sp. SA101]
DAARLYEVVHCFAYTLHIFSMHHDLDFSEKMVSRIEKRWKGWEQPILLLSIILHPSYKLSKFRPTINNLSWTHVGQWLKYYYHAFCGKPATSILAELIDYRRGNDPYDYDSFLQFKGNVLNFWESTIGVGPELAKVAIRIHAVCVNSASVERLWSSMGYFHTNRRNRLSHNKVLAMSQIRSNILYQRQIKKDDQTDIIKQFHIPKPTILDHFDENDNDDVQIIDEEDLFVNENHETNDDDFLENDNESVNSNSDKNVNQWNIIVAHWRDEANQENQLENHSDEGLLEEDLDNDFLVGVNNIHPADNVNLKWELSCIFVDDLEPLPYFFTRFDVSETGILSVSETIKDKLCIPVCTLSGANIANKIAAQNFSDIYNNLGRYWSGIVWSIENVIVIGAGIVDGLKRGENTKMTIIRVEFLEMKKFIQMFYHGVKEETFSELWNCQCDCYLLWRQIC